MGKISLTELGKQLYMRTIHEKIKAKNYIIIPRDKNEYFINKYMLDKSKIDKMLLLLREEDIQYELEDNDYLKYGPENLIVFKKEYELTDFYGNNKREVIYIKIKMKDKALPIISFHLDE